MSTVTRKLSLPAAIRTIRIVWAALVVSSLLVPVVLYVAAQSAPVPEDVPPAAVLSALLGVVSLVVAVVSFVMPARLALAPLKAAKIEVVEEVDPDVVPGFYREGAPKRRVLASRKAAEQAAARIYMTTVILRSALRESIPLFGGVLLFVTRQLPVAGGLVLLGVVLLLMGWPREREALELVEQAYDAKLPPAAST